MSKISFRVISIEFKDSTFQSINKNNLIRLNLTQKPGKLAEEYLLGNVNDTLNINHEFVIDDSFNKVEKLSMTVRSVVKKTTFASFFGLKDDLSNNRNTKDHSVDRFVGSRESRNNNITCEYTEPRHSLIGYCQIDVKEIKRGINNNIQCELITKKNEIVGYVNLDVYIWDSPSKSFGEQQLVNNDQIIFVDPGCPAVNA